MSDILDEERIRLLDELGRRICEDTLGDIAQKFLSNLEERLDRLADAVERKEGAVVELLAHSLKGSASNLGASQIAKLSRELEEAASAGDLVLCRVLQPILREAAAETRRALDVLLAERQRSVAVAGA